MLFFAILVLGTFAECGGKSGCSEKLLAGDGNCNSDDDCAAGLFCGQQNCVADFGHSGGSWDANDNCCVDPDTVPKEFSYPRDNLAAIITNFKYSYHHIDVKDKLKLNLNAGDANSKSLWQLREDDHKKGYFWLYHPVSSAYMECAADTQTIKIAGTSDNRNDAQLWKFKESKLHRGRYYIMNYAHPTHRLAMYEETKLACYNGGDSEKEYSTSQKILKLQDKKSCRSDYSNLPTAQTLEKCADLVRDHMKDDDYPYAQHQPTFTYAPNNLKYCIHYKNYGCSRGYETSLTNSNTYQLIDDSSFYMALAPHFNSEWDNADRTKRENQCGWDNEDKNGQRSLGEDTYTIECLNECLNAGDDKPCAFASKSYWNYCHLFRTCTNTPKEVNYKDEWFTYEKTSVKGNFIDQLWSLHDIYTSDAIWNLVLRFTCTQTHCTPEIKETIGTENTFEDSMGEVHGVEKSMQESAGLQLKKLNLGAEHSKTVSDQYSSSISSAQKGTYSSERVSTFDMVKDQCVELRQITIKQNDAVAGVKIGTGVQWYMESSCGECDWYSGDGVTDGAERINIAKEALGKSECLQDVKTWNENQDVPADGVAWWDTTGDCIAIRNYEGRGKNQIGLPGINQWFTCAIKSEEEKEAEAPMQFSDAEQGKQAEAPKEESVLILEPQEDSTTTVAVYAFAAVGLGILLYGSSKHFMAKETQYEEITPLQP